MQQGDQPAFEVSPQGVIWYLNQAASEALRLNPQQAVNTRLSNYVVDGLMTQRRLEALNQGSQSETWRDAWRRDQETISCEITAFFIPASVAGERHRIIVLAKNYDLSPGGEDAVDGLKEIQPSKALLRSDKPVLAGDLERLREKLQISTNRLCELLGISMVSWYTWRKTPQTPISSRSVVLHLRLLDAMPELAQLGAQPADLQEALRAHLGISLTFSDLAFWMGADRRSGYAWGRGYPASDPVRALTASLLYIVLNKPREAWWCYQTLLEQQAELEKVNFASTRSWATSRSDVQPSDDRNRSDTNVGVTSPAKRPRPRALGTVPRSGKRRS